MKHKIALFGIAGVALAALVAIGCGGDEASPAETGAEPVAGPLSLDDAVADPSAYAPPSDTSAWEAEDPEEFESMTLALEQAPPGDTADASDLPQGADVYHLLIVWGRPVFTPEAREVTDWTGQVRVTEGVVRALRLVRFDAEDRLVPDEDPAAVHFVSKTRPHHDGLLLRIVAPKGSQGEVVFETAPLTQHIPFEDLAHLHAAVATGQGEGVLFVGKMLASKCAGGFLKGFWKRLGPHGGLFGGAWFNPVGDAVGRIFGIWGRRKDGKRVVFGMLVSPEGLEGMLAGTYAPFPIEKPGVLDGGVFKGLLVGPGMSPLAGFKGAYTEPIVPGKGLFLGGWLSAGCLELPEKACSEDADPASCDTDQAEPACACPGNMPCMCSTP